MCTHTASVLHVAKRIQQSTPRTVAALLTDASLYLADACAKLHIDAQTSRLRVNSRITATPAHIASALVEFALEPTKQTAQACYRVIAAHNAAIIRRSDSTAARLIDAGVRAPDPVKPNIQRCPAGSLDWQTQPVIGVNPAIWAEGHEMAQAIEKRDRRIRGTPRREVAVVSVGAPLLRGNYRLQTAKAEKQAMRIRSIAGAALEAERSLDAAVDALARLWGAGVTRAAGSGPA